MECRLCPRKCGINREETSGFCGAGKNLKIARAALHFFEEPCISGERGSGAVFFSGCALKCVYCQNKEISLGTKGIEISVNRLRDIFYELYDQGAHNINLVTGDHYIPEIAEAAGEARSGGLEIPFIFNCSGYETEEALKLLNGLVDVYLPDFKYADKELAKALSNAPDYPETAKAAIAEMVRQRPQLIFDEKGMIKSGVIVRNLLLPGHVKNSKAVLKYLKNTYGDSIYISIMSQYTPMPGLPDTFPELKRRVTKREYDRLTDYALALGIENAFIQETGSSGERYIPAFDLSGVKPAP